MNGAPGTQSLAGAGWTFLALGVTRGIGFAATLVLARLLDPDDFGLMALAILVVAIFGSVSTLGQRGVLIVEQIDQPLLATALAVLLCGGAAGALVVALAAGPLASLFGDAALEPVLRAMSITLLLTGAITFYEALLQRALRFRARFVTQLVQSVSFAGVALVSAASGAGVWSLVAGQLAGATAYTIALLAAVRTQVRPRFVPDQLRRALLPGRGFLAQGLLQQVQQNVDIGATAYYLGAQPTGYYSMAFRLADLPYFALTDPVATVAFPTLARSHRRQEPTAELGLELFTIVTLFTWPVCLLLSAAADPFVEVLLGDQWAPIVASLSVLGVWAAIVQVEAALGWFLNSLGFPGVSALISAIVTVPLIPAIAVAAAQGGIVAVAWAMLGAGIATSGLSIYFARRRAGLPLGRQFRAVARIAVAATALWLCARVSAEAIDPALPALAVAIVAGLAAYSLLLRFLDPGALRLGRRFIAEALGSLRGAA